MPAQCAVGDEPQRDGPVPEGSATSCATTYQPAGRYWTFQWIEFVMFVVLAAVCVAAGVVVLRRRDA